MIIIIVVGRVAADAVRHAGSAQGWPARRPVSVGRYDHNGSPTGGTPRRVSW
jgi:hypothetical protein